MSTGKILLGVLAGVAAGAALGILLAPDKGSETRKKITKKGEDYVDGLKDKFDDMIDGASKKFDNMKEEAVNMAGQAKHKMEEAEAKVMSAANGRS